MFTEELMEFGLSEKEAKVYLALLEIEVATVQEIAKAADVNRSSAYVVLESLKKRGLVSVSAGKKVQKYIVAPPDRLVRMAEQAARRHVDARDNINKLLPDLKSLYKGFKMKPRIRVFEGPENVITCMEESLLTKEKVVRIYASGGKPNSYLNGYMPTFLQKRAMGGIKMYGVHPDNSLNQSLVKYAPADDEIMFIPEERYRFSSDICIFDSCVGYISREGDYAIVIESDEIANAMKEAFDLAFEGAQKLGRNPRRKPAARR